MSGYGFSTSQHRKGHVCKESTRPRGRQVISHAKSLRFVREPKAPPPHIGASAQSPFFEGDRLGLGKFYMLSLKTSPDAEGQNLNDRSSTRHRVPFPPVCLNLKLMFQDSSRRQVLGLGHTCSTVRGAASGRKSNETFPKSVLGQFTINTGTSTCLHLFCIIRSTLPDRSQATLA